MPRCQNYQLDRSIILTMSNTLLLDETYSQRMQRTHKRISITFL